MKRLVAIGVVALLASPTLSSADRSGILSGRILVTGNGSAAKAVWLADPDGGTVLQTIPVAADGSFRSAPLGAGRVAIAVETGEGLYTVDTPVAIAPGASRSLSIALRGRQDTKPDQNQKKKTGASIWNNPLVASLIVIGGAVVVGVAIDQLTNNENNKTPVSPSVPGK